MPPTIAPTATSATSTLKRTMIRNTITPITMLNQSMSASEMSGSDTTRMTSTTAAQAPALEVAHVNRQLQRLRSREHMGEAHDLDEAILGHPVTALDHLIEHHGDLRHRTTDVDEAQHEKVEKHLAGRGHGFVGFTGLRRPVG